MVDSPPELSKPDLIKEQINRMLYDRRSGIRAGNRPEWYDDAWKAKLAHLRAVLKSLGSE